MKKTFLKNLTSKRKWFFVIIILMMLYIYPNQVDGQNSSGLSLQLDPENPGPTEQVQARLTSRTLSLKTSDITWFLNNSTEASGSGLRSFEFTTGDFGEETQIKAHIRLDDGRERSIEKNIIPSKVDLLWEADTYTPSFYKGRSLASHNAKVTIQAIPFVYSNGQKISPDQLVYRWEREGQVLNNESGIGQDTLIFEKNQVRQTETVSVSVRQRNGETLGQSSVNIGTTEPEALIYQRKSGRPNYEKSLKIDNQTSSDQVSLIAEPFFFSIENLNQDLAFSWQVGNDQISTTTPNLLSFSFSEPGATSILLEIENRLKSLQTAESFIENLTFQP